MDSIKVGIVGCGYWGPNLIRNFSSCPQTEVVAVCDANPLGWRRSVAASLI